MNRDAMNRIVSARSALVVHQPFHGTLALHLQIVERPDISTMATDGMHLFYSRAFVDRLSDKELTGVLLHEIEHCARLHFARRSNRDMQDWNKACDYAINSGIIAGGFTLPKGALIDPRYDGLGAEAIYRMLRAEQQAKPDQGKGDSDQSGESGDGQGQPNPDDASSGEQDAANGAAGKPDKGQGEAAGEDMPGNDQSAAGGTSAADPAPDPGGCGGIIDPVPSHDAAGLADIVQDWQAKVKQAIAVAKAHAGTLPDHIARIAEDVARPRVDWRDELRRLIDESAISDYAWHRPSRRFLSRRIIVPGLVPDALSHIVAVVDTSGSINDAVLSAFRAEIADMLDSGTADRITVVYADAAVRNIQEFERGDILDMQPVGGGGTNFRPSFTWIAANAEDASVVIYLTDMETVDFGDDPGAPVIWAVYGYDQRRMESAASMAPFGETIYIV